MMMVMGGGVRGTDVDEGTLGTGSTGELGTPGLKCEIPGGVLGANGCDS